MAVYSPHPRQTTVVCICDILQGDSTGFVVLNATSLASFGSLPFLFHSSMHGTPSIWQSSWRSVSIFVYWHALFLPSIGKMDICTELSMFSEDCIEQTHNFYKRLLITRYPTFPKGSRSYPNIGILVFHYESNAGDI